ncbi:hypothetical protein [Corynebacterium xerosis]|uniref:Uncharacterized protein n=1 Tax=Corynebacterium xerosis TaxID=1725 RepID=A0A7X9SWH6_9CORY|nr:hypothetical protein [Corynebacterium xerosis]NMF09337.1 hypothetical protein [Corynebacterium xerosis]
MIYSFEIAQTFVRPEANGEPFDEFLDRVIDEAEKIDLELDYGANLEDLRATWHITVDAEGHLEALISATTALRTALHAAHCATPNWVTQEELESVSPVNGDELTAA